MYNNLNHRKNVSEQKKGYEKLYDVYRAKVNTKTLLVNMKTNALVENCVEARGALVLLLSMYM